MANALHLALPVTGIRETWQEESTDWCETNASSNKIMYSSNNTYNYPRWTCLFWRLFYISRRKHRTCIALVFEVRSQQAQPSCGHPLPVYTSRTDRRVQRSFTR